MKLTIRESGLFANSVWNLSGQVGPTLAGLLLIPRILLLMGNERFALLAIAWMVIGYFGFFDLGLTRAITQLVAGETSGPELHRKLAVALTLVGAFGVAGGLALFASAGLLANRVFHVPPRLVPEVINAIWIMGLSLPPTLLTSAYRSMAEGRYAFANLNLIRTPLGIANFIVPWAMVNWTTRVDIVIASLMLLRIIGLLLHLGLARKIFGPIGFVYRNCLKESLELLKYGGWITVSNLLSPLMTNFDRFVIGAMLSLSAVSYYVVPYEAVTKMWIVAGAVGGVIFPYFSKTKDTRSLRNIFAKGVLLIGGSLAPFVLIVLLFSEQLLRVWINPTFAHESAGVARLLAIAVLVNGIALVPFSLIQGQGKPDITAKFHLAEFPLYFVLLVVFIRLFGIEGAALAYLVRVVIDVTLLILYSRRYLVLPSGQAVLTGGRQ